MKHTKGPLDRLKHHVTGAIERGEKQAIIAVIGHTKGPWETREYTPSKYQERQILIEEANGNYVAQVNLCEEVDDTHDLETSLEEQKANASLIAAAPEMLEALERLLTCAIGLAKASDLNGSCYLNELFIADKAIKKARGGSQ